jgi:phosphopantothenoylcysteine decarboxylase/phosphopantothenate--cysteine ligase
MSKPLRILITAGPTHEPIDPVRYIGNNSSGRMGAALAEAALAAGHRVTVIVGPVSLPMPLGAKRIDIETAAQMEAIVLEAFPSHDLLIMAAAVADYRPVSRSPVKLGRGGSLTIHCEPTSDIVAAAARARRADQRIIGFSLEAHDDVERAREKLKRKGLDLIVFNPLETMNSANIAPVLLFADGDTETLQRQTKADFARILIERGAELF